MDIIEKFTDKKFLVLIGEFGSGKSELSLNIALREGRTLVDLDIAKPMNASRDFRGMLQERNVQLVAMPHNLEHMEMRVLPSQVPQVLGSVERAVFDVGGGDSAVVAGQFAARLAAEDTEVLLVVNTYRPFSANVQEIVDAKEYIEEKTRLKTTGIVCNCNLAEQTTLATATAGLAKVRAAAEFMQLPLVAVVYPVWLKAQVTQSEHAVYFMERHFKYIK